MRTVIIGAGLSGLVCGGNLARAGHEVTLLDKGRSPGGRLATRRVAAAQVDHGAQFFTVRSDEFAAHTRRWAADGVVHEWCRGFSPAGDGYPRYAAAGGMNRLAKHLATDLDVRCNTLAFAVRPGRGGWEVQLDDNSVLTADALVITCPLPQAFALTVSSGVEIPADLRNTEYDRTLSILVALDRPGAVPAPGGLQNPDDVFSFIGDNVAKGASSHPAITFHANAAWSDAHWDDDRAEIDRLLLEHAQPWIGGANVIEVSPKRWRFATPRTIWPERCWADESGPAPLLLAGDAFAGPRVEGAALSGLAAASWLASRA